jgi:hypothetical protein
VSRIRRWPSNWKRKAQCRRPPGTKRKPRSTAFVQAMNQLERLQRLRKGDSVAAPVNLQIFGDTPRWRRTRTLVNEESRSSERSHTSC